MEQINELAKALALAQSEIVGAVKDSTNPHFKSKYADLESVWDAIRIPLSKNGLSVAQLTDVTSDGKLILKSVLLHTSGQSLTSVMPVLMTQQTPQACGSAISYARRYALAALVGVYQTDDDAEAAQGRKYEPKTTSSAYQQPSRIESKPSSANGPAQKPVEEKPSDEPKAAQADTGAVPVQEIANGTGQATIGADQVNQLLKRLKAAGKDTPKFYEWLADECKTKNLFALTHGQYAKILNMLGDSRHE
jgi:hypothetical protein